ncbi:GNAT family N-acetyltransferase [Methylobacterium durans]|uniref:GNAT family N-acetyltransferase n=1 Tax=Methylobacterium durans TaxID=2202825 RepID=UPI002AFF1FFF|nr:GNAT family N-acetyltransferase [Methylobacterium durans]MEA1833863.1 GNAT family N-acetyltransferase [Methylobacterium durans]
MRGQEAANLLRDSCFQEEWDALADACPWATACQSYNYISTWFEIYSNCFEPLFVIHETRENRLGGLLALAISSDGKSLVHAGACQAEYQVWLARPSCSDTFILGALSILREQFPGKYIRLQYVPDRTPMGWISHARTRGVSTKRTVVTRPLLETVTESHINASLRKKSNRSRINRLQKIAELKFTRISKRQDLEPFIGSIADFCDLRQGAINRTFPFRDDPNKKEFWLRLLEKTGLIHASALMLGDTLIAVHIGPISRSTVSLGIICHSPFFSEHSPGKLLILHLAKQLAQESFSYFDLTAGGDEYKNRFASRFDQASILEISFDGLDYYLGVMRRGLLGSAKHMLGPVATSKAKALRRRFSLSANLFHLTSSKRKIIYHSRDTAPLPPISVPAASLRVNCLSDLLLPKVRYSRREMECEFLAEALRLLEAGARMYTYANQGILLHCSWVASDRSAPPGMMRGRGQAWHFWETYSVNEELAPNVRVLSLSQRLHDAKQFASSQDVFVHLERRDDGTARFLEQYGFIHVDRANG